MDSNDHKSGAVNLEAAFFAKENARLLTELRAKTEKDERRRLLRQVVRIKDEAFLDRLIALGIGPETAMALRLIPLVFVAWADGEMDTKERDAILTAAREQGLAAEDMTQQVLKDWLRHKPDARLLSLWKEYVGHIWTHFTDDEQIQMRQNLLQAAEDVANSAGGFLGLSKISTAEREVIEDLQNVVS
jgi:tellurite resistance protein